MEYPNPISVVRNATSVPLLTALRPEKITFIDVVGMYKTIDPKIKEYSKLLDEDLEFGRLLNSFFLQVRDKCWNFSITDDDNFYDKICIKLLEPYILDSNSLDEIFMGDESLIDFNRIKNSITVPQNIIDMIDKFKGLRLLLEV